MVPTITEYKDNGEKVEILDYSSLFLTLTNPVDIEFEKYELEAVHQCKLEAYRVSVESRPSGAMVTKIEWRVV